EAARDAGLDAGAEPGPAPPAATEGAVRRITSIDDVPLVGDRVDAKPGDYLLVDDASAAVVSARGMVADFGPRGGIDAMTGTEPTVFGSLAPEHLAKPEFAIVAGGHALRMTRRLTDKPARLDVFFSLRAGALAIESVVTSTGDEPLVAETLGEMISWGNVPTWIEGVGFVSSGGAYPTDFVARESLGLAYAMGSDEGRTIARVGSPENNGFHDAPYLSDRPVSVAAHASSPRRDVTITWSTRSLADAALALPFVASKHTEEVALPMLPPGTAVEIARCEHDHPWGPLVTRFGFAADRRAIRIPDGCHGARLTRLGHAPGPWVEASALATEKLDGLLPKAGTIRFSITEKGKDGPLPARLLFRGLGGTPNPTWGDDPFEGAALDTIYSTGTGVFPIPPGRYEVRIQRGFEYDAVTREIEIKDGQETELDASLERVVDTAGWISADLHVHAAPSPDAPAPLRDRVRSLAASGVEVAVATDHNRVTDYGPTVRALGLGGQMASVVGDEITTREPYLGHYNTFPLRPGAAPVLFEKSPPDRIFDAARAEGPPGIVPIVQVNHPRMGGIGYFDLLRFDGTDVERWRSRSNLAALQFDALEVFNGDHYAYISKVEEAMKDWFALLKAGFRDTATGNSDSHKLTYAEAGVPRNFVRVPNDDPAAFDPAAFVDAIRGGRVVVSSGPFVRLF
ncbi:MAG TPA: CehA/McbA family metallohydrolase, partial [Minicystis sp.]|nr:CehA/McbA family metallohydrolase [Minicystis sp.]